MMWANGKTSRDHFPNTFIHKVFHTFANRQAQDVTQCAYLATCSGKYFLHYNNWINYTMMVGSW